MMGREVAVLFVCLGNICRSPTAHGVFATMVNQRGLEQSVAVDSCGTGGWHVGEPPDGRASAEALNRGYDLSALRARQVQASDFQRFDYILAMDEQNLLDLRQQCPENFTGHLGLFLDFAPSMGCREVPDPYYGGAGGFTEVLDLIEAASTALLDEIVSGNSSAPDSH